MLLAIALLGNSAGNGESSIRLFNHFQDDKGDVGRHPTKRVKCLPCWEDLQTVAEKLSLAAASTDHPIHNDFYR